MTDNSQYDVHIKTVYTIDWEILVLKEFRKHHTFTYFKHKRFIL